MTLSFTQKIKEKPTYFIEKIWACLYYGIIDFDTEFYRYNQKYKQKFTGAIFVNFGVTHPKRHSIRKDASNRWKAGNKIHPVINNRTPERFQFAPTIKCISTQKIEIKCCLDKQPPFETSYNYSLQCLGNTYNSPFQVFVDDKLLNKKETIDLAINDGFDSVDDFFEYFNTSFTGKIIHWTNLKY